MNPSKRAMYDDLFFMSVLIILGVVYSAPWLAIFGAFFLAIRLYHLTHQDEVFGVDGAEDKEDA